MKRIRRIKMGKKNERIIAINDLHIPFHDNKTLEPVYKFIKEYQPDKLIMCGDMIDFYSISRFDKDPSRKLNLEKELKVVSKELKRLRSKTDGEIYYIKGNHEERLNKYVIRNARELYWMDSLSVDSMLGLKDLDITYINERSNTYRGTTYSHMNRSNSYGGYSAKNIGQRLFGDLIHGHSHKVGKVRMGEFTFIDNGCLCELKADYLESPAISGWAQAFAIVTHHEGRKYMEQVDINKHRFIYNDTVYG